MSLRQESVSPQQDINLPLVSRPEGDCWNRGTDILPVLVGERRYRRAFSRPMAIKCNRTEKGLNRTGARTETTSAVLKNLDFFFPLLVYPFEKRSALISGN